MRMPFQMLMEAVDKVDGNATLGDLSALHDEPIQRIMDAIDAVRVCRGEQTYLPAASDGERWWPFGQQEQPR